MRIALLLLVAANLLAFAWGQGWLAPVIGDVRQPERLERQVGPERLRVLRRDDPHPKERVVAGRVESRSEEHTSELQSRENLVCRLLLDKKNINKSKSDTTR